MNKSIKNRLANQKANQIYNEVKYLLLFMWIVILFYNFI